MKTQLTTQCVLIAILCILVQCSGVQAGKSFRDDFTDGDIQDGSPVSWQWDPSLGQCTVSSQGLQLSPAQVYWSTLELFATDKHGAKLKYDSDITVRTQFNLGNEFTTSAIIALITPDRQSNSGVGIYNLAFNRRWFALSLDNSNRDEWHWSTEGRFDPAEDIIMQLDLIDIIDETGFRTGSRVECRWWVPGEEMPSQAQIVGEDSIYDVSGIMLGAGTDSVEGSRTSPVIFRWIEVIGGDADSEPVIDFNGDGIVDMKDLLRLIESWGRNDPTVDIAPHPFGDGVVDALDLELLMSYWGQSLDDPSLIAHWTLDETEGTIAYDRAGVNDAFTLGEPMWQPGGGQINGALLLDGIDDCAVVGSALNPADGSFSIFTWINSGLPGQVIMSQQNIADWFRINAEGNLTTELKASGRSGGPLHSQAFVTDGSWHRIGFVWDGLNRSLYVDDILVAEDTQDGLESSNSDMYIGTGKLMTSGTYFSGLIDDIRIYNRTVHP